MSRFKKQAGSEFGRSWLRAGQKPAAPAAAGAAAGAASGSGAGQAVASFYGSLVQTSGKGWVSGGKLHDGGETNIGSSSAGVAAAAAAAGGGAGTAAHAGEPTHAGLGSAAERAELEAEAAQLHPLQYPAPAGPAERQQQGAAAPASGEQQQQQQDQQAAARRHVQYGISRGNVGYQLLKKAGWTEGAGLGAREQGMAEPVAASQQKGNLGLGYAPKPPPKPAKPAAAEGVAAGAAGAAQQARPRRPLPEDPLAKEDTDTKVKRVRQVMQAEADEKAGKAIARYIRMALNDSTGEPTRDSNPLLRRNHKLSATNPLL